MVSCNSHRGMGAGAAIKCDHGGTGSGTSDHHSGGGSKATGARLDAERASHVGSVCVVLQRTQYRQPCCDGQ